MLFKISDDESAPAQIRAFTDTWSWGSVAADNLEIVMGYGVAGEKVKTLVEMLGHNAMSAYLVMMASRLFEMVRVLKPTGSVYLHCDPTASHYIKIVMDTIFGAENFRNEIVWKRTHGRATIEIMHRPPAP